MNTAAALKRDLKALGTPEKAKASAWFFKTGPRQYGEGDVFVGVTLPEQRKLAKRYRDTPLVELKKLLMSEIHEERLTALIILVGEYKRGDTATRREIYDFYLSHTSRINNWDLVDCSAEYIVGAWLDDKDKSVLIDMARSDNLWERRIAIISTFHYIKQKDPRQTLKIAKILLHDKHDLIHKAAGWMLREVGKRCSQEVEEEFLQTHYKDMPRTMLRYAIERFPKERREQYMKGLV